MCAELGHSREISGERQTNSSNGKMVDVFKVARVGDDPGGVNVALYNARQGGGRFKLLAKKANFYQPRSGMVLRRLTYIIIAFSWDLFHFSRIFRVRR